MKERLLFSIVVPGLFICIGMMTHFSKALPQKPSNPTLKQIATIDLPGEVGNRFDYLTIDYKDHYLLSAHLGAGLLYVIDLNTNKLIRAIPGVPGVEGVEYVPELNKVYTSNWKDQTIGVIDLKQMKVIKKIPAKKKPDGSAYAADFKKLYVSDERANTLIVIDVNKDEVVKLIHFESETGMPQYDSISKKIYLNLQDQNLFAVIDPAADSVIGKYPVGEGKGNHGMALDIKNRRAFLSCESNDKMVVFDLDSHKTIVSLKMASGADVIKFDPGLKRIYVACSSGSISVFREDDPLHFTKLEDFPVQRKVHSLAVDIQTHRVYAPEQEENGKSVSRMIVYEAVQ